METISFQAPKEIREKLEFFAESMDRSKAYLIRQALVEYLEDLEDYHEALKENAKRPKKKTISLAEMRRKYGLK